MSRTIDFLSIGDITTDAFILLKEAENNQGNLCMRLGMKLPYKQLDLLYGVGNAANAAVCAARLGLKSYLLSDIGDDAEGKKAISSWQKDGINTSYVKIHEDKKTNFHFVLRLQDERTILIKHQNYNYSLPKIKEKIKWVYLTSIGKDSLNYHREIVEFVKNQNAKLAFQPGTFQIEFGEKLEFVYKNTEIFFSNKEEAQQILNTTKDDIKVLLYSIHKLGPKKVVITDGRAGIYAYDSFKKEFYHLPIFPDPKPPVDRTGAGDATSATIVSMLAKRKSFEKALLYGPINSMSVVQYLGAQKGLLSTRYIEKILNLAPKWYNLKKI